MEEKIYLKYEDETKLVLMPENFKELCQKIEIKFNIQYSKKLKISCFVGNTEISVSDEEDYSNLKAGMTVSIRWREKVMPKFFSSSSKQNTKLFFQSQLFLTFIFAK